MQLTKKKELFLKKIKTGKKGIRLVLIEIVPFRGL